MLRSDRLHMLSHHMLHAAFAPREAVKGVGSSRHGSGSGLIAANAHKWAVWVIVVPVSYTREKVVSVTKAWDTRVLSYTASYSCLELYSQPYPRMCALVSLRSLCPTHATILRPFDLVLGS